MKIDLLYTTKALQDLQSLDRLVSARILTKLEYFCFESDFRAHAKPLSGGQAGLFRFRVGDYRAIFKQDSRGNLLVVTIIRVRHRKDVYE